MLDLNIIKASFGATKGGLTYNPIADVNHDGVVNVVDLAIVSRTVGCTTTTQ
jgi:hypothetical protein